MLPLSCKKTWVPPATAVTGSRLTWTEPFFHTPYVSQTHWKNWKCNEPNHSTIHDQATLTGTWLPSSAARALQHLAVRTNRLEKSWGHCLYMCVCLYCFYLYIVSICFYLCAPPHRASRSPWISFSRFSLRSCQASWSWKHWYVGEQGSCWKTHPYNGELEIPFHCHLCGQSSATITIFDHPNPGDIQSHRNQHWLKSAPAILVGLRFGHALILQLRHVLLHYGRWQLFHHVAISKSACGPYAGFSSMG